jgi:HD superfamily phosphohydrolase
MPIKRKIVNDPVYGFITISDELSFSILEHPWFQRLRRISQLGLTSMVYPGHCTPGFIMRWEPCT